MIMINNVIVESDVYENYFVCNIERCKGVCCVEGDFGAPLEQQEEAILADIYDKIPEYLEPSSVELLEENGPTTYYPENKSVGTPVHEDGRCAYAVYAKDGGIGCGIENAWREGKIDFRKPISCHLYPIRIKENPSNGMEMMTYERWGICNPACSNGEKLDVTLHEFAKDAIIRKYGEAFYDQLLAAVDQVSE